VAQDCNYKLFEHSREAGKQGSREEIAMQFPTERRELIILRIIDNFFLHAEPKLAAEQIYLKNVFACGHQRS
jgi:hypothetical protein